jgi:hypothetical protein
MRNLGRTGRGITALVGREVKRTFSEFSRISTGLSRFKAAQADGQEFGDFRYPFSSL